MADELKIPVSVPGAQQAEQSLKRVADAERRVGREAKDAGDKAKQGAVGMQRIAGAARSILGALGIGVGIGAAVSQIVKGVKEWYEWLDKIAKKQEEVGRSAIAFAMMQEPGEAGKLARQVMFRAAAVGVERPEMELFSFQSLQAKLGTPEKAFAAIQGAWALQKIGVPSEAALSGVSIGMSVGLSDKEAVRALYAAGQASELSPAQIAAHAGKALPMYQGMGGGGPLFGYQVMAALSGLYPAELGTYARAAGQALGAQRGPAGDLWKKLGITAPGADPLAQIQALRGAGLTTASALQGAGLAEIRQAQALAALAGSPEAFALVQESFAREYSGAGPLAAYEIAKGDMPQIAFAERAQKARGTREFWKVYGPSARAAMERQARELELGAAFEAAGYGSAVTEEGRVGFKGLLYEILNQWSQPSPWDIAPSIGTRGERIMAAEARRQGGVTVNVGGIHYEKGIEAVAGEPVESGME